MKSGGNDFHGSGFFAKTGHRFEGDNLTPALRQRGITRGNPVNNRTDASGELGGRMIPDNRGSTTRHGDARSRSAS